MLELAWDADWWFAGHQHRKQEWWTGYHFNFALEQHDWSTN